MFDNELDCPDGVETREEHESAAGHEGAVQDDITVDVRARQSRDYGVSRRSNMHVGRHGRVDHHRLMSLHGSLGIPGRARGVTNG